MKRRKQPPRRKPARGGTPATTAPDAARRSVLRFAWTATIGAAAIGAGGYLAFRKASADVAERDLSSVGRGQPAVVQIHDPTCPICRELQRETRQALDDIGSDRLLYRVADITTTEGANFAARHGVAHVTLLLFDGGGRLQQVIEGPQERAALRTAFRAHLERTASS